MVDFGALDRVVNQMLDSIETSKDQIYSIAENARQEYRRVNADLDVARRETLQVIKDLDECTHIGTVARNKLMEVSRDFESYSESDIETAYDYASSIQLHLRTLREKEHLLKERQDELEQNLKKLAELAEKAESLCSQVGVVLQFVAGNLEEISTTLDDLQKKQQSGLRIIKAQEEERKRVARDIHDGPAQSMANLVLRLEVCERLLDIDTSRAKGEIQELKGLIRSNLQEIRRIIFDLRHMNLDSLGLVPTIRQMLTDFGDKHKIAVSFELAGEEKRCPAPVEITVLRLVQEALQNVRKHSMASRVLMKLELDTDMVSAVIKDNGRGFNMDQLSNKSQTEGFGLVSMKERAELLNGEIIVKTGLGQGTELIIKIPLKG